MARKRNPEYNIDDIIAVLAVKLGYRRKDVDKVVRSFMHLLIERFEHGKGMQFREFGRIEIVKRQGTRRWDFKQQKVINTSTLYGIRYEPSENIKKALRKLQEDA